MEKLIDCLNCGNETETSAPFIRAGEMVVRISCDDCGYSEPREVEIIGNSNYEWKWRLLGEQVIDDWGIYE